MKKLPAFIACLVALVALAASACGPVSSYAATVNGIEISQDDLNVELEAIRDNKDYAAAVEQQLAQGGEKLKGSGKNTFDSTFVARVLTRQIYLALITAELKDRKIKITDEQLAEARKQQEEQLTQQFEGKDVWNAFPKEYQDTLARRFAEIQALQEALAPEPDAAAVQKYYEENKEEFNQTCSRHILAGFPGNPRDPANPPPTPQQEAEAKAKAEQWKARVDRGEDFAAIARAESTDTGSGGQGGDLGCRGGFVQEFTEAMDALQPGQTSGPVRTQFGYHIIQVTSRGTLSLEEATPQIQQILGQESQNAVQDFVNEALGDAKIKVNPKYGTFEKGDPAQGTQPQVVPPKGPATTTTTEPPGGPGGPGGPGAGEEPVLIPEEEGGAGQ